MRLRINRINLIIAGVESSNIRFIGYKKSNKHLFVIFKNEKGYIYENVSFNLFTRLLTTKSKGKFFNKFIKDNPKYPYSPVNIKGF